MAPERDTAASPIEDVSRRTWLAAERTWLAWWRTGIGTTAVAIGVGRLVPQLTHSTRWPFVALGIGYAILAVAVLVLGATRQQRGAAALRRGGNLELSSSLVAWLTGAAVLLALGTLALVAFTI